MFDLKVIHAVLGEMEEERGISRAKMIDAIEQALATAYKKEFGKRGQIITCRFDLESGDTIFNQVKIVVDESMLRTDEPVEGEEETEEEITVDGVKKVRFDEEKHIMVGTARMIKKDVEFGDELVFPLESKADFGRIAAQTAKQVVIQKIREAEKLSMLEEFGEKKGEIVGGIAGGYAYARHLSIAGAASRSRGLLCCGLVGDNCGVVLHHQLDLVGHGRVARLARLSIYADRGIRS